MLENEITNCLKVVHVYEEERGIPPHLEENVNVLDKIYPKLKIDLVSLRDLTIQLSWSNLNSFRS